MRYQYRVVDVGDEGMLRDVRYKHFPLPVNRIVVVVVKEVHSYRMPSTRGTFDGAPFQLEKSVSVGNAKDALAIPMHAYAAIAHGLDKIQLRYGIDIAKDVEGIGTFLFWDALFYLSINNEAELVTISIEHFYNNLVGVDNTFRPVHIQIYNFKSAGTEVRIRKQREMERGPGKILFVVNRVSGKTTPDWEPIIRRYFEPSAMDIDFYHLPQKFTTSDVRSAINSFKPGCVVAVGGDGTVNLLATCIMNTGISLGILPAGSANGMARELGIGADVTKALEIIKRGRTKRISLLQINDRISVHLSDLGLNAHMLREFERGSKRGFMGYILATLRVFKRKKMLEADIRFDNKSITVRADIILIANATTYGTGVLVNPVGKLDDNVFEVIAITELTLAQLLKSSLQTLRLDESKAKIFQVSEVKLHCKKPAHFQVDGEYLGKVEDVGARLLPDSLDVIVPDDF
jgi:diacylglycerol kinase (ATP)